MSDQEKKKDPLHGVTLEMIIKKLADYYGWRELWHIIPINCFKSNPSIKSSLKFLRRTPWARQKVERLYLDTDFNPPPADDVPTYRPRT